MPKPISHAVRRAPLGLSAGVTPRARRGRTPTDETPLTIRARGLTLGEGMQAYVAQRAGFGLGRFSKRVQRVSVRFEPVRRVGESMAGIRCRIKVVVTPMQSVLAEATSRTARSAFGDAIRASSRAVRHLRERRRRISRKRRD